MSGVTIPCLLLMSPPQTDGRQPQQFSGLANEADVRSELGNVSVLSDILLQGSAAGGGGGGAG